MININVYNDIMSNIVKLGDEDRAQLAALPNYQVNPTANLMLALAEGRIQQFVRSNFRQLPTNGWPEQWALIEQSVFTEPVN